MYEQSTNTFFLGTAMGGNGLQARASNALYRCALAQGRRGQWASMLTGRSRSLLKLADVEAGLEVHDRCDAGVQTVAIDRIRGSGSRAHDFDREFHPLQSHTRARWQGIDLALQKGVALPPVALIQIGDIYFVQDGHHRISVAQANGQRDIEGRVTAWQVTGPLPWEHDAKAPRYAPASQSPDIVHVARAIRSKSTQLGERFQQSLQGLLNAVGIALRPRSGGQVEKTTTLGPVSV